MNEITKLYDAIRMPQSLQTTIRNQAPVHRSRFRPAMAVAAMLVMVCMAGCSPAVRRALEEWTGTTFTGLDLTIYEKELEGGAKGQLISIDTEQRTFAQVENGRLYFTGNGQHLDITDQITGDKPYFYTYEEQGYEIVLVVGCNGSIENFGTYEFIRENDAWITGSGRNTLSSEQEGVAYPWVEAVWAALDIPWPIDGQR